jgi:nucleotide-binding universal stress UspA family protein
MYHVAVGIASEDELIPHKVDAVSELPHSTDSVRVTLIHVHDGEASVESVPPVTEAIEGFTAVGIETEVHSVINEDAPRGLLEGAAALDADLLCIGGRRRSPAGKFQLKTGAQEVLIHADQPVVVAGKIDE